MFAGDRANPDFSTAYVAGDVWPIGFPILYFICAGGQPAVTVERATLAALIAVFHGTVRSSSPWGAMTVS